MSRSTTKNIDIILVLLAVSAASISLLQSMLNPVLSMLETELDTSANAVSWVLISFLLSGAVCTPILGRVGDMIGKVRTLLIAVGVMAAGNVVSALASNIEIMVLGRVLQGVGMASFPLSFGIVRDEFPNDRIASGVGMLTSVIAVGGGLGAVLAGPIVGLLGWRWLFWLPTISSVVVAAMAHRFIPESQMRAGGRINWLAAMLLAGWLVGLLLPLSQGTHWGWNSPLVLGLLIPAVALLSIWIAVEARSDNPLVDMQVMRLPTIWKTNLMALLFGASMFSVWIFVPRFMMVPVESGYGFGASVTEASWIILPMLVTMAVAGTLVGRLHRWVSFKTQLSIGAALVAAALFGFAFLHDAVWHLALFSTVHGLGLGLAYSNITNLVVRSVPATQTSTATGMNANIRTIGGAMGTTLMTAIVTTHQQAGGIPSEHAFTTGFAVFACIALLTLMVTRLLPGPVAVDALPSRA